MGLEYVIVYPYLALGSIHRSAVEQNYFSHVINNPNGLVVPVSVRGEEWILDTVFVRDWLEPCIRDMYKPSNILLFSDYLFLAYLRSPNRIEAEHYIFADWDTYSSNGTFQDFLGDVWDSDVSGGRLHSCCGAEALFWCGNWCGCTDSLLTFEDSSVMSFSKKAALAIASSSPESICSGFTLAHGSVRIPTLANSLGYRVQSSDSLSRSMLSSIAYNFQGKPAIYQSVHTPLVDPRYASN